MCQQVERTNWFAIRHFRQYATIQKTLSCSTIEIGWLLHFHASGKHRVEAIETKRNKQQPRARARANEFRCETSILDHDGNINDRKKNFSKPHTPAKCAVESDKTISCATKATTTTTIEKTRNKIRPKKKL